MSSHVEYRILSAAGEVTALQRSPGRHRRQDDVRSPTATSEVNFSTVYLDASQRILAQLADHKVSDLSDKRGSVAGAASLRRTPPLSVVNWARLLGGLAAARIDIGTDISPGRAGRKTPYLHIVGPHGQTSPTASVNWTTSWSGSINGTLERIRNDGTWNVVSPKWLTITQLLPAHAGVCGLMAKASETERSKIWLNRRTPRPRRPRQFRPLSTQAVFRPVSAMNSFPIRRSARTPSRKGPGWPPPAGCAHSVERPD